jgi:hypothetical protein
VIDTWEMTISPVDEIYQIHKKDKYLYVDKNNGKVTLPGKPYIALRLIQVAK